MRRSAASQAQIEPTHRSAVYARGKPLSLAVSSQPDPLDVAIVSAVLYSSLFDYPLTLSELRRSLTMPASHDDLDDRLLNSTFLRSRVTQTDGFVVPAGGNHLIAVRERREARSRAFLAAHASTLRVLCSLPFTRLVAISGSLAHLNADDATDLDLFVVAAEGHVWTVGVLMIAVARLLGRRRVVCANYILGRSALALEQSDWFTANQVIALRPVDGRPVFEALLDANPFVRRWFPNAEPAAAFPTLPTGSRMMRLTVERMLRPVGTWLERTCRWIYEGHLRHREATWPSPGQVRLSADVLKLHTRSHRESILARHAALLEAAGLSAQGADHPPAGAWPGSNSRLAG